MQEHQCVDGTVQDIEMWADINGYEGRYQVSDKGRVKSLARMRRGKGGSEVPVPEKIMALTPKKDTGRDRKSTRLNSSHRCIRMPSSA